MPAAEFPIVILECDRKADSKFGIESIGGAVGQVHVEIAARSSGIWLRSDTSLQPRMTGS